MRIRIIWLILISGFVNLAHAQLMFDKEEISHEAGLLDESMEAVFSFRNVGDRTITVTALSATCGCTVPQLEKRTYAPGESGEIHAKFTFGSRVGEQHKRITVTTEGAGQNVHVLNLITRIPEWMELQPRILRWKLSDSPSAQELQVDVPMHEQIKLSLPEKSDNFDIRIQQRNPGKYSFMITPRSLDSRITEYLKIRAVAVDGGNTVTREFGVHCLVR